ncbi:MAG: type II toxin-antitoxin system death-on-curing family toxin [Planctomycetales bacterium]|nr:type II toxin-antitoxin system death-on-curing family toxin [Planctomycetales bacterium]
MPPLFLELDKVLEIHRDQIERYGGTPGVRQMDLLESAIGMPRAGMSGRYFHADLFEMAAAYLFHIVSNHPFVDGNKRVGAMAAYAFLRLNGWKLRAPEAPFEALVRSTAEGRTEKAILASFLREHSRRVGERKRRK